jgi:hypothetical protein
VFNAFNFFGVNENESGWLTRPKIQLSRRLWYGTSQNHDRGMIVAVVTGRTAPGLDQPIKTPLQQPIIDRLSGLADLRKE